MALPLLKPDLYSTENGAPILLGGRCVCGFVFFPMQHFGCERCGRAGDSLSPQKLHGTGRLLACVVVHMHADTHRKTPFNVGTIALDDGPIIRTIVADTLALNSNARRVRAILLPVVTDRDVEVLDLRFEADSASGAS